MTSHSPLSRNIVHVWLADLDGAAGHLEPLINTLSSDERDRADRFVFERDRKRFVAGRAILRFILAQHLNIAAKSLQFCYGARGKPALTCESPADSLEFNLAHSEGHALYAIALGRRVGIDLEFRRTFHGVEDIAQRFFSRQENDMLRALPPTARPGAFLGCWTRKEAFIKAVGAGMSYALDGFTVTVTPGQPAELLHVDGDPDARERWWLRDLTPGPDFVAALCVEGTDCQVIIRHWESGEGCA